jgi:hypothetical protein
VSLLSAVLDAFVPSLSTQKAAAQIATVGGLIFTAGQARVAIAGLKAFDIGALDKAVSEHLGNLADDEAVANDVLALLASVGVPGAAEVEAAAKLAEVLIPFVLANQKAHPIEDPVREAQTSEHRGGRRA